MALIFDIYFGTFFFLSEEFYEMEYCVGWNVNLFIKWRWMMRFDIYYGIVFFDKVYSKLGIILENVNWF